MKHNAVLIGLVILIAGAFAVPVGADTQKASGSGGLSISTVEKTLDFCDAWSYTSRDKNVSLTIEKCDADSRTLILKATMRTSKNATLMTKDASAKVVSKVELKSLSAGTCTAASKADCTDKSKEGTAYSDLKPTYDKDKGYVLAEKLTEKDLPQTYKLTFDKDDKLDGTVIKLGTNTEALLFDDDGTDFIINTTDGSGRLLDVAIRSGYGSMYDASVYGNYWIHGPIDASGLVMRTVADTAWVGEASGVTCVMTKANTVMAEIDCNKNDGHIVYRFYAGQPFWSETIWATSAEFKLIGQSIPQSYWVSVLLDGTFYSPVNTLAARVTATEHTVSFLQDTYHVTYMKSTGETRSNDMLIYGDGSNQNIYDPFSGNNWEQNAIATAWFYFPKNATPITPQIASEERAIFNRLITYIDPQQGTKTTSTNISMAVTANDTGGLFGCDVYYTSNATLLADGAAPMFAECNQLGGLNIYIYNDTGTAVLDSTDLWMHGINESGGWTWKDAGGSTITLWNDSAADGLGTAEAVFIGNDVRFLITNTSMSGGSLPYSNIVISPVSPQTFPMVGTQFNVTWNSTGGEVTSANLTFNGTVYPMSNVSKVYYVTVPGGVYGAGTYGYVFNAEDTLIIGNSTASVNYVVNQATGSATASSTGGWLYLTGLPTTLSCAGTTPKLYLDHLLITNPYTATLAVGTYSVVCNSTDTVNYTAASDSKSLHVLPAGIVTSAYDETTGSELVYNLTFYNASYSKSWTNLGITFFALGNTSLPTGLVTLEFSANLYGQRTYYRTVGGGALENLTAYLLPLASGSYIRFHTLTYTEVGIPGALVQVNRSIGGVTTLIGEMTSDSTGTATFFLNPLVSYTVYPSKVGYTAGASSITPSGSDYKLYMTAIGTVNVTTQFSNLVWNFTPACGGITNSSTTFFYYISDSNSSLNSYGFNVSLPNGTTYSVNGTLPGGSRLNLTLDLRNFSGQTVNITRWFNETGYPLYVFRYGCIVWNTATGNSLFDQLAALKAGFCPMPAAGEIPWCLPLNIMALMVTTAVGAVGAARFGANGGGMAAAATLWVFTFLTWWPWQPALLLTLGMIGVMVMTRRLG